MIRGVNFTTVPLAVITWIQIYLKPGITTGVRPCVCLCWGGGARVFCTPVRHTTQRKSAAMDVVSHPRGERHVHGHSLSPRCSWMHPHVPLSHTHQCKAYIYSTRFLVQERGWRAKGKVVQCWRDATSRTSRNKKRRSDDSMQVMMSMSTRVRQEQLHHCIYSANLFFPFSRHPSLLSAATTSNGS